MTAINNKIQQSILPLSTSYCLTNSSLENNRSEINDQDVIIGEQWIVLAKIGEGSFGEVFEVKDINTGRHYAVKREPRSHLSQIKHESILYDILAAGPGIPQCHWYGRHEEFDCIVMDLLGTSLKQLRQSVRHIPLSIIKDLGCQMIDILEHIHNRGLLYRDVKPDNFLFSESCRLPGYDKYDDDDNSNNNAERKWEYESCQQVFDTWKETKPKLYVVDLGLASCWRNLETKQPYPECKKRIRNKTGTARYASLNVHRGKTPARRDDMESLGYLLVDLALGSLPWTGIQAKSSKAGWDRMHMMKENIQIADLCSGLPSGFMTFIDYTRRLGFNDQPDYQYLRQLLLTACVQNGQSITATTTTISGNKTKQDHRYQKRGWRTTEKIKNKNYEDVFHMDDLAHDLPIISTI
ncbi:kinase-like domain-containing protein [Halteromyces radiatus]|uniref:kinase-like domain-containing protein n=1 Tax=Halteromyces radiatus TaxID=101107 RepID=UPI0022203E28|nr:kinase-like domain-containing protein [Halteromyces radiatus]KAI8099854.1 kinase-like domain-containing protein [Halteromyces radiatus]